MSEQPIRICTCNAADIMRRQLEGHPQDVCEMHPKVDEMWQQPTAPALNDDQAITDRISAALGAAVQQSNEL